MSRKEYLVDLIHIFKKSIFLSLFLIEIIVWTVHCDSSLFILNGLPWKIITEFFQ